MKALQSWARSPVEISIVVLTNAISVYGVFILGWAIENILILYWIETLLTIAYCATRILSTMAIVPAFRYQLPTVVVFSLIVGFFAFGFIKIYALLLEFCFGVALHRYLELYGFLGGIVHAITVNQLIFPVLLMVFFYGIEWRETSVAKMIKMQDEGIPYKGRHWFKDPFFSLVFRMIVVCMGYCLFTFFPNIKLQLLLLSFVLLDVICGIYRSQRVGIILRAPAGKRESV